MNPTNILQQVRTYNDAELGYLLNSGFYIRYTNKKFENFQTLTAQLGQTVGFELPYRSRTVRSLNISFEGTEQRIHTLTVDRELSNGKAFTDQQFVYTVQEYMEKIGKGVVEEMASEMEADIATINVDHTYRCYGDGRTPIDSFGSLALAMATYEDYGAPKGMRQGVIPLINQPSIVNTGLGQFALDRNNKIANSWELGSWANTDWYTSNLLPIHYAGTVGVANQTLTVVSTNDPTGANITQITFSGASASDPDAIKKNDIITFKDVAGLPILRYLTFIGHKQSANRVQVRATADAVADGSGNVTVNIFPALNASGDANQNIYFNIVAGMQAGAANSHRAGVVIGGNACFLAMPKMPDSTPYLGSTKQSENGASMRIYYGQTGFENRRGLAHDQMYGFTAVDEYLMRLAFPL